MAEVVLFKARVADKADKDKADKADRAAKAKPDKDNKVGVKTAKSQDKNQGRTATLLF